MLRDAAIEAMRCCPCALWRYERGGPSRNLALHRGACPGEQRACVAHHPLPSPPPPLVHPPIQGAVLRCALPCCAPAVPCDLRALLPIVPSVVRGAAYDASMRAPPPQRPLFPPQLALPPLALSLAVLVAVPPTELLMVAWMSQAVWPPGVRVACAWYTWKDVRKCCVMLSRCCVLL
jgi:hypothetical protein